jgi:hypothetical protein
MDARERVEKLFNEGRSEADVIAARPLKRFSMPSGLRATTRGCLHQDGLQLLQAVVTGDAVARWRPAPAQRSAVEVAKQYGLLARAFEVAVRPCCLEPQMRGSFTVRRQPRDARRRRGMRRVATNIASTGLVLGSSAQSSVLIKMRPLQRLSWGARRDSNLRPQLGVLLRACCC